MGLLRLGGSIGESCVPIGPRGGAATLGKRGDLVSARRELGMEPYQGMGSPPGFVEPGGQGTGTHRLPARAVRGRSLFSRAWLRAMGPTLLRLAPGS